MRPRVLVAALLTMLLANLLVFGAIGTNVLKPTPRPPRTVQAHATFTRNPDLARRLVTTTPTPLPTPTRYPTSIVLKEPRRPFGGADDE